MLQNQTINQNEDNKENIYMKIFNLTKSPCLHNFSDIVRVAYSLQATDI